MFRVSFKTENDAFAGDPDRECSKVLQRIKEQLGRGVVAGKCFDTNGNSIGTWELVADRD